MKRSVYVVTALVLVALLLAALPGSAVAQQTRTRITYLLADKLYVGTGGVVVAGDVDLGGALDTGPITTDSVTAGVVGINTLLSIAPSPVITVTNGVTVTPTGSYVQLASSGNVGTGAIAAMPPGTVLALVNTVNTTITFTDTGTLLLGSNLVLGQYDTGILISDGTNWIEYSRTNN